MSCDDEDLFKHIEHINKRHPVPQITNSISSMSYKEVADLCIEAEIPHEFPGIQQMDTTYDEQWEAACKRAETYDPETDTFTVAITEVPEQEEKPHYCQFHPTVAWCDHKNGRGKNIYGCPECSGIIHTARGVTGPLHTYPDATYWRERPLTAKEKQFRPRRGS